MKYLLLLSFLACVFAAPAKAQQISEQEARWLRQEAARRAHWAAQKAHDYGDTALQKYQQSAQETGGDPAAAGEGGRLTKWERWQEKAGSLEQMKIDLQNRKNFVQDRAQDLKYRHQDKLGAAKDLAADWTENHRTRIEAAQDRILDWKAIHQEEIDAARNYAGELKENRQETVEAAKEKLQELKSSCGRCPIH
jgi:hypothetical protein